MKRIFLLLALALIISSCTHKEHSYSSEWMYDDTAHMRVCTNGYCDEMIAYAEHAFLDTEDGKICIVCGYKNTASADKSDHTHTLSGEYTSNSTQHWCECTECNERVDINEHVFGEITVTVPPSSDSVGEGERYCTVCGKLSYVSVDRLPERMSKDEWEACFSISNVRIQEKCKNGSLTASDTVYEVDKNIVAEISSLGTAYYGKHALAVIDFSEYYDNFSNYGEGVYRSSGFEMVTDDGKMNIREVEVRIDGGLLASVSYSVNLGAFGAMSYTYTLYDYGKIALSPTYLDKEDIEAAIDANNFQDGFSLTYEKCDASGKSTETQLTIQDGSYVSKKYQGSIFKGGSSGDADLAAEGLSKHLNSIFEYFGSEELVYEDFYNDYTYVGGGVYIPSLGLVIKCDIILTDGHLSNINIQLADGSTCYYYFSAT